MAGSSLTRLAGALLVGSGGGAYTLTAQRGTYSLAGQSAALNRGRSLSATRGSYSLAGQQATITYTPAATGYTLTALAGSYSLAGRSAAISKGRALVASPGSYSLAGRTVTLLKSRRIQAQPGSFSLSGQSATLTYTGTAAAYTLTAQTGSYSLSGKAAQIAVGSAPVAGGHGFEITDTAPRLWWTRRPKAMPEREAQDKIEQVARVIRRIAGEQVAHPQPARAQKTQVREAIAPLVAQMPGFDWVALWRALVIEQAAQRQALEALERARAAERDDEDALILLMATT